jgi:hypothetical protein
MKRRKEGPSPIRRTEDTNLRRSTKLIGKKGKERVVSGRGSKRNEKKKRGEILQEQFSTQCHERGKRAYKSCDTGSKTHRRAHLRRHPSSVRQNRLLDRSKSIYRSLKIARVCALADAGSKGL